MKIRDAEVLVIGSGAAGLCAAVRLHELGKTGTVLYTEGLDQGTSINTGSDKQTYYKLGMYGTEPDSPVQMAGEMCSSGASHGDIALTEAALSPVAFANLVRLGVPFPHDEWGQYIGYKTDHDPKRRATSCGPYTSREMCRALIRELKEKKIEVHEKKQAVQLLTNKGKSRCFGAVFMDRETGEPEAVLAENTVFAVGGPGGLYEKSVYPVNHTGSIGLAMAAGARCCNLTESQFGLASTKFRWNVSGSFMQVIPRFVSVGTDGDEKEFLNEYFSSPEETFSMVFLKGYQWPFSCGHLPGSSLIDLFTWIETEERGRRVFLDYRRDPEGLDPAKLSPEAAEYLKKSGATGRTPLERLLVLNSPSIQMYREHGIDLETEMLEVAVCAQHNNGGLQGDLHWESVNLRHFYPVGEVNGSHGVTRPGGTALNAGQAGAFRCSEHIAFRKPDPMDRNEALQAVQEAEERLTMRLQLPASSDWREERKQFQKRMSRAGGFIRSTKLTEEALDGAWKQLASATAAGLKGLNVPDLCETLRNEQLILAHLLYLESILMQIDYIGSRGGSFVLAEEGDALSDRLPEVWKKKKEDPSFRGYLMVTSLNPQTGFPEIGWEKARPVPKPDGWFETVWREFREGRGQ